MHLVSKEATFLPKSKGGLGVRSHRVLNTCLIAKLAWKLRHGPHNLAKECVELKYIRPRGVTKFNSGSQVWQSVGWRWHLLEESCAWVVGKGKTISLCEDNWLGIGAIRNFMIGPLKQEEMVLRVKDCWVDGKWQLPHMSLDVPNHIIERVECIAWKPAMIEDSPFSTVVDENTFSLRKAFDKEVENLGFKSKCLVGSGREIIRLRSNSFFGSFGMVKSQPFFPQTSLYHKNIPTRLLLCVIPRRKIYYICFATVLRLKI